MGGILASVNRRVNKNGMPWASAQLEDLHRRHRGDVLPHAYSAYGADIVDDAVVLVNAKVAIRDDRILIANELVVPDFSNAQPIRPLAVSLPTGSAPSTRSARSSRCWRVIREPRRRICASSAGTGSTCSWISRCA